MAEGVEAHGHRERGHDQDEHALAREARRHVASQPADPDRLAEEAPGDLHLAHRDERESRGEQDVGRAAPAGRPFERGESRGDQRRPGEQDDLQPLDRPILAHQGAGEPEVHDHHRRDSGHGHDGERGGQCVVAHPAT
jgi:hypothetical protein